MKVPGEQIQHELKKRGLQLADFPGSNEEPEHAVLIGADYYWQIVTGRVERLTETLVALESTFGWSVQGPVSASTVTEATCMFIPCEEEKLLSKQLKAFWEKEYLGAVSKPASETTASRERAHDRGRSHERKHHHSSADKQRYYSCDRYCSRGQCHSKSSTASCAASPSEGLETSNKQGSGWVKGSPVALSSNTSTPSRGRRQLPKIPHTPRPGVAYKTANSSPVHFVSSQTSLSPGRLSRGLSEHNGLRYSSSHHFPCPVTRISSEPFLGQGQGKALGSLYGSLRDQLQVFQDMAALSPSPCGGHSSWNALPRMMGALSPAQQQNIGMPNGYHISFGGSTSPGSGVRAARCYQEAVKDEWC
ncbi:probable voltage-dependent N-type calcium channel subunit alpha-1B [Neolamprologus brichardi]|uniref:probable voltage-dependent N-type calcium channel subunit alpha-1B n=1 Tax=Neolamprologus brichardi TaxID=32507 RepID=UPI001643A6B2|nr:probable voltage-dependent N-type calcium channel subunit alpha-1B [Neolamprologus brichardi]